VRERDYEVATRRIQQLEAGINRMWSEESIRAHILRNWPRDQIVKFCNHLMGDHWQQLEAENAELTQRAEKAEALLEKAKGDCHDWYCGCGHWNGANLEDCAQCGRRPGSTA